MIHKEHNNKAILVIPCERVGDSYIISKCPFCHKRHEHSPEEGHRLAHCNGGYEFQYGKNVYNNSDGYYISLRDTLLIQERDMFTDYAKKRQAYEKLVAIDSAIPLIYRDEGSDFDKSEMGKKMAMDLCSAYEQAVKAQDNWVSHYASLNNYP